MNILDTIVANKKAEVTQRKQSVSLNQLEKSPYFMRKPISLAASLIKPDSSGVIAEFKRKSPSKGMINANALIEHTTQGYANAGAAGLSILTDTLFFGGKDEDVVQAREVNSIPILRKEFIVDEYQIIEAKSIGADAILLIAAVVDVRTIQQFTTLAHSLKMEVLLEVHDQQELEENIEASVDMMGVNNRNLKTFEVDIAISKKLAELIPSHVVKVSESGISKVAVIHELKDCGYQGFLMGEAFMKETSPAEACRKFIQEVRQFELNK